MGEVEENVMDETMPIGAASAPEQANDPEQPERPEQPEQPEQRRTPRVPGETFPDRAGAAIAHALSPFLSKER